MDQFEHGNDFGRTGKSFGLDSLGLDADGEEVAQSHYQILDVDLKATRVEVREAFLRLKSTYAAGSAALYSLISEEDAKLALTRAEEAFRVLNDDVARRDYDLQMGFVKPAPVAAPRRGFEAAAVAPEPAAERIMRMREQAAEQAAREAGAYKEPAWTGVDAPTTDSGVVRTTRSTLPVIKLKAQRAATEDVTTRYRELIAASDPGDGDLFKRLREAAEVSEDEMVERTKISMAYVRSIEINRFDRLPQAVYVKGFLRSYFRYLGVAEAETLIQAFSARLTDWQQNRKS